MVKIDLKDRKILAVLDMEGNIPISKLAKKVGLSRQIAEYRMEKLVREGVINGFYTVFDSCVVGMYWYKVMLRLGAVTVDERKEVIEYFKKRNYVLWLGELGGKLRDAAHAARS